VQYRFLQMEAEASKLCHITQPRMSTNTEPAIPSCNSKFLGGVLNLYQVVAEHKWEIPRKEGMSELEAKLALDNEFLATP